MSRPFNSQRIALLVDVQNIYYPAKSLGDKVDFHSLLKRFSTRNLVRAIAYVVEAPDVDISPFVTALRSIGFEVKTKPIKIFDDGTRKGDIDMMLALDALSVADKVDVICLVSGDGVYVELVHHLHARGVKVELMSFKSNTSSELLRVTDSHTGMNEEYLLGYERGRGDRRSRDGRHGRGSYGRDERPHRDERSARVERSHDDRRYDDRRHEDRRYPDRGYGDRSYAERSFASERKYESSREPATNDYEGDEAHTDRDYARAAERTAEELNE